MFRHNLVVLPGITCMRDTKSSVIKGQRDFIIVPLSFMINFSLVILQRSFHLSDKSHWVKFQFH